MPETQEPQSKLTEDYIIDEKVWYFLRNFKLPGYLFWLYVVSLRGSLSPRGMAAATLYHIQLNYQDFNNPKHETICCPLPPPAPNMWLRHSFCSCSASAPCPGVLTVYIYHHILRELYKSTFTHIWWLAGCVEEQLGDEFYFKLVKRNDI